MTIDMNLISLKDGGRFAMSWIAGTNPKALRSNFQRHRIYSVDVTEVCEEMIKSVKTEEKKLSFRILFRLCFGTVQIYAEQVQHLYDVTLNFVCFNTFVLKQYSRKRLSSTGPDSSNNKRIRLTSCDDLDISSLLVESEIFNNYTEDRFQFPNEVGHNSNRKQNTSTCIQIKQITIRHVSWDEPMPEDEDTFGDASQDERSFLLSGLNDGLRRSSCNQKRKTSYSTPECSPFKRPCYIHESIDDVCYDPSTHSESVDDVRYDPSNRTDTIFEADLESINQTIQESEKNTIDFNDNDLTQIDFESTRVDTCSKDQESNNQISQNQNDHSASEDSNDIPLPDILQDNTGQTDGGNLVDNPNRMDSPISSFSLDENPRNTISSARKRKHSDLVFDTLTKIPKTEIDDVFKYCHDFNKREHLASAKKPRIPIVLNKRIITPRFQSEKLLTRFNKNVKLRLQQNHDYNRRLIVEDILGENYDEFKSLFKIKETYGETRSRKKRENQTKSIVDDNNNNSNLIHDNNNNIQIQEDPSNYGQVETNGIIRYEGQRNHLKLNCSLDEINPFAISFNFPLEAETQRSEWGKEGIMAKLLFAWTLDESVVNMKTIIVGANRINAALAFHTLLDLAGQQYIEIVKDETNSIESIEMGPETIKKINQSCA